MRSAKRRSSRKASSAQSATAESVLAGTLLARTLTQQHPQVLAASLSLQSPSRKTPMTDPARHPSHSRGVADPVEVNDDPSGDGMVRSEERLAVTMVRAPYRRVRIGKRVVTETRTVTVDIQREELYIEESDPTPTMGNNDGDASGGLEMILSEEHMVVERVVTPVERIRITVGQAPGAVDVAATVAKERVTVGGPEPGGQ